MGTALIEHGLAVIQDLESARAGERQDGQWPGYIIGLTSSPQGQELYKRYGFRDVYWFNPKFDDVDGEGQWVKKDVRWPLMMKE